MKNKKSLHFTLKNCQGTVVLGVSVRFETLTRRRRWFASWVFLFFFFRRAHTSARDKNVRQDERCGTWRREKRGSGEIGKKEEPAGERGERTWRIIRFEKGKIWLNGERRLKWRDGEKKLACCYCSSGST